MSFTPNVVFISIAICSNAVGSAVFPATTRIATGRLVVACHAVLVHLRLPYSDYMNRTILSSATIIMSPTGTMLILETPHILTTLSGQEWTPSPGNSTNPQQRQS